MPSPSGSTSVFGFPYLLETDVPDVATASQELAQDIENEFIALTTSHGGTLGSPYTCTGSLATFLTTASLTVGTWLIDFGGVVLFPSGSVTPTWAAVEVLAGSATATFQGKKSDENLFTSAASEEEQGLEFRCLATVTVAGTLVFQAIGAGSPEPAMQSVTAGAGLTGCTGYAAVRIA